MNRRQNQYASIYTRLLPPWLYGLILFLGLLEPAFAIDYYVSSALGDDANDGQTPSTAFQTVARANQQTLLPGDRMRFRCGDLWRGEMMRITSSGDVGNFVEYGSYPTTDCANRPVLSGSQPIAEWALLASNIYVADLNMGVNSGLFPLGINQLFRNGSRLLLGRWPNLGDPDGGYSTVDAHTASSDRISDNELPAGDWSGAVAHIRGMQWYIMNREVSSSNGIELTLGETVFCFEQGSCEGWGYFLNSHLATLDQEGEWFYENGRVYLYTLGGVPTNGEVEGSVIRQGLDQFDTTLGAIQLGANFSNGIANVVVENFRIEKGFSHGITTPTAFFETIPLTDGENRNLIIRNNEIIDVDQVGIYLKVFALTGDPNTEGTRGGRDQQIIDNTIDGANEFGIETFSVDSTFARNRILNIGLIENLGRAGMGCGFDTVQECTLSGSGIRIWLHQEALSGHSNLFENNVIERIAMGGIDASAPNNTLRRNFIREACFAKADCGGIRIQGPENGNIDATDVHDILVEGNIVVETIGNTDGCRPEYDAPPFGFGIYADSHSRDITIRDNTVAHSQAGGIIVWWHSTAEISGNTLYNNGIGGPSGFRPGDAQIEVWDNGADTHTTTNPPGTRGVVTNNILYGIGPEALLLRISEPANLLLSDFNLFFNPYRTDPIEIWNNPFGDPANLHFQSLSQWQAYSPPQDANSIANWFTLPPGAPPLSRLFFNADNQTTTIDLGLENYLDLAQMPISYELVLDPYASAILIQNGPNQPPNAAFTSMPGAVPLAVDFDASTSTDPEGGALTYQWTIDGQTLSGVAPTYTFNQPGSYPVILLVTDPASLTDFVQSTVQVMVDPGLIFADGFESGDTSAW